MYYCYILQSLKDKRTYTGYCKELNKRLEDHNRGLVKATNKRRPFKILYFEKFKSKDDAKRREKYWKSGGGRRKLKYYFRHGFPPAQQS